MSGIFFFLSVGRCGKGGKKWVGSIKLRKEQGLKKHMKLRSITPQMHRGCHEEAAYFLHGV